MIPSVAAHQLRDSILDYLRTTFDLQDPKVEAALFEFLRGPSGLFRAPYLDLRLPFRSTPDGEIPLDIEFPNHPYAHQLEAFERLASGRGRVPQPTLVTTGTGSGKTECFTYPILDHCLRHQEQRGIKAILLYPMNALASDQAKRLAEILCTDEFRGKVTAGLYVGGKGRHGAMDSEHLIDDRAILRQSPPDILLTNYRMLDFLLLRPEDKQIWENNGPDTLRYLVLDELHTYDGAQGSDVACLIRRLKARLSIPEDTLCPVGTSATIGDSGAGAPELLRFATQVFGQEFDASSLIGEQRQQVRQALGSLVDDERRSPKTEDEDALRPENTGSQEDWIRKQVGLWFPEPFAPDPLVLGQRLKTHPFLRQLLRAQGGRVRSVDHIQTWLGEQEPGWTKLPGHVQRLALESFVGLLSHARTEIELKGGGKRVLPFMTVQVQLWMRELRRLLMAVTKEPVFAWESAKPTDATQWLPMASCRSCGTLGWAAAIREGERKLQDDPGSVGRAWFERARGCRFLVQGHGENVDGEFPDYLHTKTLELGFDRPGTESLPVRVSHQCSEGARPRFLQRCPDCDSDLEDGLSMFGARAASLLSVGISYLYQSEFNEDRKLLAFTDSVQDASHRAGFFGARTYRFNLRTALQGVLEQAEEPLPLPGIETRMREWLVKSGMPLGHAIATLLPSDLRDLPEYEEYREFGDDIDTDKLIALLDDRVSWEVAREYGHNALIGRTLEKVDCSTVEFDAERLERVAELLKLELQEGPLADANAAVDTATAHHFLAGFLNRLRVRGGVVHPMLHAYIGSGGKRIMLSRWRNPLISPFGPQSRLPRFLTDRDAAESVFESVLSAANRWTWHRDWAARCLGIDRKNPDIPSIYREALRRLTDAGVLQQFDLERGRGQAWGIRREALQVTRTVGDVVCPECRSRYAMAASAAVRQVGRPCPYYRCPGILEATEPLANYYGERYRSGAVERIFAREHTGLLQREDREDLEEEFKADEAERKPGAANLLVCTPTLEMGIDIGDLSAVVLCSVPPDPAKYLQRVGRAGRKTGNALCLTIANTRPHDLHFFAQPEAMLAGHVNPPGCFLDAPEMLKRQLLACSMDSWSRQEEELTRIPGRTSLVLSESGRAEFPGRFLTWYREHHETTLAAFLEQFGSHISPKNRDRLRDYSGPRNVEDQVNGAFDAIEDERKLLRSTIDAIRRNIQKLQEEPELSDDAEGEIRDLQMSLKIARGQLKDAGQKYPLNVLTDAGFLPNYAFPEPGVTLRSSLSTETTDRHGKRVYDSREYMRAASSAIREFAPFNTFYAEGHRVQIQEVDLRPPSEPVPWRICAKCAHMEEAVAGRRVADACPRCGDGQWSDSGQVRDLVNFRRVRTLTNRLQAAATDNSDEREQRFYQVETLIDVGEEHYNGARVITDLPFGIELLHDLTLREVNFGDLSGRRATQEGSQIAGRPIEPGGFEVCTLCGKVRGDSKEIDHARWCRAHRKPEQAKNRTIHLAREVTSEAIRLLLPVAEYEWEKQVHNLRAALALGIRKRFKGNPQHLKVAVQDEPVEWGGRRRFLVIFDTVPGGTGYLSELAHFDGGSDNMRDVLRLAYTALEDCACQHEEEPKRGCYQCLFAYQEQRNLDLLSNVEARRVLGSILDRWAEMETKHTLSEVTLESTLESELEHLFRDTLADHAEKQDDATWSEGIRGGRELWTLEIGGERWEISPQESLGERDGVQISCRPDFVIRHASGDPGILPIAVFCDGFEFHAFPGREKGRIGDDFVKRNSILESSQWCTWSVTWKDVTEFREDSLGLPPPLGELKKLTAFLKHYDVRGADSRWAQSSAMKMLLAYLRHPQLSIWRDLAGSAAVVWASDGRSWSPKSAATFEDSLGHEMECLTSASLDQVETGGTEINRVLDAEFFRFVVRCPTRSVAARSFEGLRVTARLLDRSDQREAEEFQTAWRHFLHLHNLLQFHGLAVITTEMLAEDGFRLAADQPLLRVAEGDDVGDEDLTLLLPEERRVVEALRALDLPVPDLDFVPEFAAEASLHWPDQQVALLIPEQLQDKETFESQGWTALPLSTDIETIAEALGHEKDM